MWHCLLGILYIPRTAYIVYKFDRKARSQAVSYAITESLRCERRGWSILEEGLQAKKKLKKRKM